MNNEIKANKETSDLLQLVSFKIDREEFGIDILIVREIIRMMDLTQVPNSPDFVAGIINLRGRIIPVINLRKKMNLPDKEYDNNSRIVVVELNKTITGFIVDEVNEVIRMSSGITEPPPDVAAGINSNYITAIGKLDDRLLILLDLDRVLSDEEEKEIAAIEDYS